MNSKKSFFSRWWSWLLLSVIFCCAAGAIVSCDAELPEENTATTVISEESLNIQTTAPAGNQNTTQTESGKNLSVVVPMETQPATEKILANTRDYILNKDSLKFHYPTCASAQRIKDSNRIMLNSTREQIIALGYVSCENCHP